MFCEQPPCHLSRAGGPVDVDLTGPTAPVGKPCFDSPWKWKLFFSHPERLGRMEQQAGRGVRHLYEAVSARTESRLGKKAEQRRSATGGVRAGGVCTAGGVTAAPQEARVASLEVQVVQEHTCWRGPQPGFRQQHGQVAELMLHPGLPGGTRATSSRRGRPRLPHLPEVPQGALDPHKAGT